MANRAVIVWHALMVGVLLLLRLIQRRYQQLALRLTQHSVSQHHPLPQQIQL